MQTFWAFGPASDRREISQSDILLKNSRQFAQPAQKHYEAGLHIDWRHLFLRKKRDIHEENSNFGKYFEHELQ